MYDQIRIQEKFQLLTADCQNWSHVHALMDIEYSIDSLLGPPPLLSIVLVEWDSHFKSLFHSVIQTDKTSRFIFVVFMLVCVVRSKLSIAETEIYLAGILCCITVSLTFLHVLESCAEKDRSNSMITYESFIARVLLPYLNI